MDAPHLASVFVATATWAGFAVKMKTYFRFADQRTAAKTWLIFTAFLCTLAQIITIVLARPHSPVYFWLGAACFGAANGLFWWALSAHGKSHPAFAFIDVPPSSLTTAGPYRLVRHPIYTAYLLAWCAGAVIAAQPWLLATVLCMSLFYVSAARQEEKSFRLSAFAAAYRVYRRRTGMFFPKVSGLRFRAG